MSRRRRLRRRLFWTGVLLGLVLLVATVSALRVCMWGRDYLVSAGRSRWQHRGGSRHWRRADFRGGVDVATK
jgi:hypothetical protein